MNFDFTKELKRENKDALALDIIPIDNAEVLDGFSKIPMWVADMNFETAPAIVEEVTKRLSHPVFGYFQPRKEYFDSIISWQKRMHKVIDIDEENIGYENGVLGCVSSAIQAFTAPGEGILLHSPTYIGFQAVMNNNGRKMILSELKPDKDGKYRMDYEDMDKKIKENNIHLCIFCSPHNPTGRVWEKEEIEKAMEVYKNNDCIVISDEIWSDLIVPGFIHTPTASVSEDAKNRTISVYAPSKTFNLAGFIGSYHIIYSKYLKDRVKKQSELCHYNDMNILSMYALIGAYSEAGESWYKELLNVLNENINYACDFISSKFDGITFSKPEGTYMLYIDCTKWLESHNDNIDSLLKRGVSYGIIWQDGRTFLKDNTIRLNLALPNHILKEAFNRLEKYVFI